MPMQKSLYPKNWREIARKLKEAANWTCQCCGARRGEQQKNRHGNLVNVVITVAHLDHDPWNMHARLQVLCRKCHITYDARDARRKRVMMAIARGQLVLPGLQTWYQSPTPRLLRRSGTGHRRRTARHITRLQQKRKEVVRA